MGNLLRYWGFLGLAVLLGGCATTVRLEVMKPAEIDMRNARTIAVTEFTAARAGTASLEDVLADLIISAFGGETDEEAKAKNMARYGTNSMIAALVDTGYFTVVSPQDMGRKFSGQRRRNLGAADVREQFGAEAIIIGDITKMKSTVERFTKTEKVYNERAKKKVKVEVPWVRLEAELAFSYRVVDTGTGAVIATRSFRETSQDEQPAENRERLPDEEDLYRSMIDRITALAARQLAPWVEVQTRTLMTDETKDPRMKQADELVSSGFYEQALNLFLGVWSQDRNPAAGYNAAIMYEIRGNLDEAVDLMTEVVDATQNSGALRESYRLRAARDEQRRVEQQLQ